MKKLLLIALALAAFQSTASAQFIDRIVRPCSAGIVPRASVVVNPSSSGNVDVTTCTGGTLNVNGAPATTAPGGSNTQFQYNDAGTFAGAPAFTYTKAATSQLVAVVPTWNSGATTFTAFKVNVTDTASDTASLLIDLQRGGTTMFRIDKFGNISDGGGFSWARPNGRMVLSTSSNGTPLTLQSYSLTAADASPGFALTGTWNTSGAPAAFFANITNTASGAAAKLLDLQIGSVSQFSVSKAGVVNAVTGYQIGAAAASGSYLRGNGTNFVSSTIQVADVPTLNQNTSGNAATVTLNANLSGAVVSSASNVTTPGKADVLQSSEFGADAGANDTYAVTLTPALTAYVVGTKLRFFANTVNTGAASVNFNSLGALAIKVLQGTADPANGDIKAGAWVDCTVKVGSICEMTSTIGNAPAAGITNSAGANVVPKSDGTNLVASSITDSGTAVAITSSAIEGDSSLITLGDVNGVGNLTKITIDDSVATIALTAASGISVNIFKTASNCADSAGAAACGSAAAGSVVIDAGSTTVVVSTTAVTANSQVFVQYDTSLGTRLGVTCNVTVAVPYISARTAATSFTVTVPVSPITNPLCLNYWIVN